jgi:hypothetical protein
MSCEDLICASCAGPVVEARCPACQSARAQMHHHSGGLSLPVIAMLLVAVLALAVMLQVTH